MFLRLLGNRSESYETDTSVAVRSKIAWRGGHGRLHLAGVPIGGQNVDAAPDEFGRQRWRISREIS